MRTFLLCVISPILLIVHFDPPLRAKGCATGHCAHYSGGSHRSAYYGLTRLHDSSFTGFIVVKNDTLPGHLSGFNTYELKLNNGKSVKRIHYGRIKYLHLEESAGILNLVQLPNRSGFFRVLLDEDSIALYDRNLLPHHSMHDIDSNDLVFRYKNFSRYLNSDFSKRLRKRIVPIINQHYAVNISRNASPGKVYGIISGN